VVIALRRAIAQPPAGGPTPRRRCCESTASRCIHMAHRSAMSQDAHMPSMMSPFPCAIMELKILHSLPGWLTRARLPPQCIITS
jgi:hypothetical protein